jgi:hypothetical protein
MAITIAKFVIVEIARTARSYRWQYQSVKGPTSLLILEIRRSGILPRFAGAMCPFCGLKYLWSLLK